MRTPPGAILLGYGGSQHSKIALAWADDLAAKLSRPLHVVVSALHVTGSTDTRHPLPAGEVIDELNELLESAQTSQHSVTNVLTSPEESLVHASEGAYLTVLGARTQGPLKSMVTGSVSQHLARHAHGPVIVVREPHSHPTGNIIVGIDGSEHSEAALEFGLRHARDIGGHVIALHVKHEQDDASDQHVDQAIAAASHSGGETVQIKHVKGKASEKLAEASHEADLLVVGTRGRSPLQSLLFGSVTQSVLQHSQCPVAVIR